MRRAIRRTFSSVAVLALAAGSVLIAVPAQADAVPSIAVTSPSPGEVIRGGNLMLEGAIPDVGTFESFSIGANWTNNGGPIFAEGGPGQTLLSPYPISTMVSTCGWPDGPVELVFQALSAEGVVAETRFSVSIADNPSCLSLDSPAPGSTQIYGGVHITGSILGDSGATYSIDWGTEQAVPVNPDGTFDFYDSAADGTHTLRVWRTGGGYAEAEFIADGTAPVVTITSPNYLAHVEPGAQFDLHATITDAAPARWELYLDGGLIDSGTDIAPDGTIVVPVDTDGWPEVTHSLRVVAYDVAGLSGEATTSISSGGPQLTFTSAPAPGAVISSGSVHIAGSVNDADLSWWEVALAVFPGYDEYQIGGLHPESFSYTFDTSTWADGPYTLVVDAMNGSGGYNRQEFPIIVDNPRTGSSISTEVVDDDVHVTGAIGLVTWNLSYSIDGGAPNTLVNYWVADSETAFDFWIENLEEGTHTIKVFPTDNPVYEAVSSTFAIDRPPAIADVVWPADVAGGSTATVTAAVTDSSSVATALVRQGETPVYSGSGAGGPVSLTFDTTGLDEGFYPLELWAKDSHGHESHVTFTVYVDTDDPGASFDAPSGTALTATSELTGYQFDGSPDGGEGSGVVSVDIAVASYDGDVCADSAESTIHATLGFMSWSATLPGDIDPGVYCITATATDGVGHSRSNTEYFPIDLTAPSAPTALSPSGFVSEVSELDWTGDTAAGLSYDWELYGLDGYLDGGRTSESHAELSSPLPEGEYSFRVRAIDTFVNPGEWSEDHTFTVDTTKPTVSITTPVETQISADTAVSGEYSDLGSGVVSVVLTFANCDLWNCFPMPGVSVAANLDGAGTWSAYLPALDDGDYYVFATATDAAGNTQKVDQYFAEIDTTAPSVPVPLTPSGSVGPVSEFDWTDVADGSHYVHYAWELLSPARGAAETACPAPPAPCPTAPPTTGTTSESHMTRITPLTAEGAYKFRVRAVDAFGNSSAWSDYLEFTIDSAPPVVYFDLDDDAEVINASTPLTGAYYDGKGKTIAGVVLTLRNYARDDDGDPACTSPVGDPITATLAPSSWSANLVGIGYGHYCVTATATDGVGNIGTALGHFWIDTIAPDAPEPIAASGPVPAGSVLDWYDVDDDSELAVDYEYEIYDPSGLIGTGHTADSEVTADPLLPSGGYHFRVRAIDDFGNVGDWSDDQSFLVDATAPTVSLDAPGAGASSPTADVTFRWTSPDRDIELFVLQVSPTTVVGEDGDLTAGETWVTSDYSQLVKGLANGRYYWHVIAYDQAWNESGWSELRTLDVAVPPVPAKPSGLGATGGTDSADDPEPTVTTEPTPAPTATEDPVEKTDDAPADGTDDAAGGSDPAAAGTGDSGFPIVWIIVGIVIVALAGGGFFIRFLLRRA